MSQGGDGLGRPPVEGHQLVARVPGLDQGGPLSVEALVTKPSASLTLPDVLAAVSRARDRVLEGADGIVVTQGTDTLEETSFVMDLLWDRDEPLVVTGAMRPPWVAGADGPANLSAAVVTAADPAWRGLGCVVVFSDLVHAARFVRKVHSTNTAAFASMGAGPLGMIVERKAHLLLRPPQRLGPALPHPKHLARVALLESTLGDDADLVRYCSASGYDGLVLAAFGGGHVSESYAEAASKAAHKMPVVLASRTGAGAVLASTYGFLGSERHLLEAGLMSAGILDARKARLLLLLLLSVGLKGDQLRYQFTSYSTGTAAGSLDRGGAHS